MAKAKGGPINSDRLKSFIERIEKLEEERAAIGGDIRDVYSEAKGVGYDVKTMRRIVQLRKKDAAERDEEEQLLDVYAHALGMVFGGADTSGLGSATVTREPTEDELMERAGKILREVDLCATHLVAMNGAPPKIEAIKALIGCSTGKAAKLRGMVIERLEGFSPKIADHGENQNENREAVAVKQPGEGSSRDGRRDGRGGVLAIPSEADPDAGDGHDRPKPNNAPHAERQGTVCTTGTDGGVGAGTVSPGDATYCAPDTNATKEVDHVARTRDDQHLTSRTLESPAGGEKPATPTGGSHDAGLTPAPEVARVVPPATVPRFDPYEEAPPPYLDQRHKVTARAAE